MRLFASICLIAFGFASNQPKRKRCIDTLPAELTSLLQCWPKKLFRVGAAVKFRKNKVTRYGRVGKYDDSSKKFVITAYDGLLPTTVERNPLHIKKITKAKAAKNFLKKDDEVKFSHQHKTRYGTILNALESGRAYKIRSFDDEVSKEYRRCIRHIIKLTPEQIMQRRAEHRERKSTEDFENCCICSMTYTDNDPDTEEPVLRSTFEKCDHHICIACRETLPLKIWTYVVQCPLCKSAQFKNPWDTHGIRDQKHLQEMMDRQERLENDDLQDALYRVEMAELVGLGQTNDFHNSEDEEIEESEEEYFNYDDFRTGTDTPHLDNIYEPPAYTFEGLVENENQESVGGETENSNLNVVPNIPINYLPDSQDQIQQILNSYFFDETSEGNNNRNVS